MSIHTVATGPEENIKMAKTLLPLCIKCVPLCTIVHCHVPLSIKIFLVYFSTKYETKQLNKSLEAKCLVSLDMIDMKMWTST